MVVVGRGDMCIERRQLCHIAHQQHISRRRIGSGGIRVLRLDVRGDRSGVGAYARVISVDNIREESFAFLPLDKFVQMSAEHVVGHNEETYRCCCADSLGI